MSFRERLHPRQSKMELEVLAELNKHHFFPCTDKSFCLLSTKPDFYFPSEQLAVYLDGEYVHRNRHDRDSYLRGLLEKRHGIKVLTLPYKRNSKRNRRLIVAEILEALQK